MGLFDAFPIFYNLISRKWLVVEQHGLKFGPRGVSIQCTRGTFDS